MRGYKFELWVVIVLQLVALEATVEKPNLLPILLELGAIIFLKKALQWVKEESYGNEHSQHHDHLPDTAGTGHDRRRA